MKQLRDSITVPLPANVTEENLLRYFESRRGIDGTISLPLRLSPRDFGIPGAPDVEHRVRVRLRRQRMTRTSTMN